MARCFYFVVGFMALWTNGGWAGDWPGLLGPQRNGRAPQERLAAAFGEQGPKVVWKVDVGTGYAGPAVAGGRVVIFHRQEDREIVECRSKEDGKLLWRFDYPTDYVDGFNFDNGPRAVPAIDNGAVYTFGAAGMLHRLDLATGKRVWGVDTRALLKSPKGFFGRVSSPWIEGDRILLNAGGSEQRGIVAFDKATGKLVWGATDHEAGYASPVAATFHGERYGLFFTRAGLVGLDPATGKQRFEFPWRSRMHASVNAANPLVHGDEVFLSACYETGAIVLKITPDGPKKVWSGDGILDSHYTTAVQHGGGLFGFHGRQEQASDFRCVEWKTGKVLWKTDLGGLGSILIAGEQLVILTENGQLVLAPASSKAFKPSARAQILGRGIRAYPALSGGLFIARDKRRLVCIDLR